MKQNPVIQIALTCTALGLLFTVTPSQAASVSWTGASPGHSLLWSEPGNWDALVSPGWDIINFYDQGSTNAPGAVNNVLDANLTISNLNYRATISHITLVSNYHTTLINPGVTLTVDRGTVGSSLIYVGHISDPQTNDLRYHYTIKGSGGKLVAGNLNEPLSTQGLQVTAVQRNYTNHIGSLDLSGLDSFSLAGGYFWVGINGGEGTVVTDRPAGEVRLAKTNLIVMVGDSYDTLNLGSFRVGESRANTPFKPSLLELGQENAFYTPWLKIGGARTGNGAGIGGFMRFRQGLENPTLKLRGSNDLSRLGTMRIGDNSWSTSGSIGCRGVVDLTGGKVDAYINELYVSRGPGGNSATAPTNTAFATGTLTWTEGTFDVLTFLVGYQYGNNQTTNSGTVNVLTPKAKLKADRLVLGRDAGTFSGGGIGILNIDGGTVEITTYLSESPGAGGNASSTIILTNNGVLNLKPEGDLIPAVATIDTLQFGGGTVTNGVLALSQINVNAPASAFVVHPGTGLNAGVVGAIGTINVISNLTLNGGDVAVDMEVGPSLDQVNVLGALTLSGVSTISPNPLSISAVSAGTFTLMTYGSLVGSAANLRLSGPLADSRLIIAFDTTAPNINMNVSGTPSYLSWSGGKNGNAWDLKTTANWNSGSEQFFAFDTVEFGDSGLATPPITLTGTLIPGGVAFNAGSKDYTLAGSGKISGLSGLTLNGSATVTILTTNDYKGTTDINAGTLVLGDGTTADGALGTGAVNNYGTLIFKPAATQIVSAAIAGSGTIVKRGSGVTRLSGANTFSGALTVESGTLQAGNTAALGDPTVPATVNSGATLDLFGFTLNKPLTVSGAGVGGAGAIVNSGAAQFLRDVQLSADTVFGGITGWTVGSSAAGSAEPGLTAYGYKISKVGPNQVKVNGLRNLAWELDLGEVDVAEGVFTLAGNVSLGTQTGKAITVRSNATLEIGVNPNNILTKTYFFNGGSSLFVQGTNSVLDGSVTLGGTVVFDILNTRTLVLNCPVTGGSLVKGIDRNPAKSVSTGNGTLVLSGANTMTGLRIETGAVVLTNDASIQAGEIIMAGGTLSASNRTDNTLTLNSGQSLKGRGTFIGVMSAPPGATIAPQATNGMIAVTGNLSLRGNTILDLNRTGMVVTNSSIIVSGTLDFGGSLTLISSGEALKAGDSFKLFSAGVMLNSFPAASVTWPALTSGLYWTNRIDVDGTVAVASTEPTTPPSLTATVSGSQLTLQWPAEYSSYFLQGQTNAASIGISNNWQLVPGVSGNQVVIPMDPANPSAFYRLMQQ